jgi:hypothetical protein
MPDKDGDLDLVSVRDDQIVRILDRDLPLDQGQAYTTISHWYSRQDLFAAGPRMEDVTQVAIGDCFLLAGVLAIVQIDPNLIYGMMRDRRGGWVVVRLYGADGQPVYYEIEKTYMTVGGRSLQAHSAWWVYMLEKAYAAHRLHVGGHTVRAKVWVEDRQTGQLVQREGAKVPARTYVDALSGGKPHHALQILLGGNSIRLKLQPEGSASGAFYNLTKIVWNRDAVVVEEGTRSSFREVFREDAEAAARKFAKRFDRQIVDDLNEFQLKSKVLRQENVLAFFEQHYPTLGRAIGLRLEAYVCNHFPGKRGTGLYTIEQERLYTKIEQMLTAQHFVAVGIGTDVGRSRGALGAANERKVKGLAGPHAYQVVGVARMQQANVKFLRLRNPWLNYVRGYNWKTAVVQGQGVRVLRAYDVDNAPPLDALNLNVPITLGAGEFLLELSDLTKRFIGVYVATSPGQALPDLGALQTLVS